MGSIRMKFNLSRHNRSEFNDWIDALDPEKVYTVHINEYSYARTLDSNSFYWRLITEMAEHFGVDKEEMHEIMKYKFLLKKKSIKGKEIITIESTSKMKQSDFNDYLDKVKKFAIEHGFKLEEE